MFEGGMKSLTNDPCLFKGSFSRARLFMELGRPKKYADFVAENPKKMEHMMVGTWVDDLTKIGSSDLILDWFIMYLRKKFVINEKSTGDLSYMLSARVTRDREKGLLYMDQTAAIIRLAEKCGLAHDHPAVPKVRTPMSVDVPPMHKEKTTEFEYLSIVGAALHICGVSRPDCAFAISRLARYSSTAGEIHVEALKRLISYLYQTRFMAITYRANVDNVHVPMIYENGVHPLDVNKEQPSKLYVDSDFAGTDGRSTAGYVIFMNGGPVIWSSKLMKVAATSSSEAEIIAAVESLKTGIHYQSLLVELGLSTRKSIDVYEDNLSCRVSAESLKCFKKARHYQSKLRFLQDCYQQGLVEFHQTKTEHMTADLFTKALPKNDHWRHTKALLAELPTKVIEETKQADSVQASKFEAAEEGDQGEESTLLEFIGSPYEITDERQLGRSVSYAGIIGELEIANWEESKRIAFWEKNVGDINEMPENYG